MGYITGYYFTFYVIIWDLISRILQELRRILPIQLEIKGHCNIGFLEEGHILIRLSLAEDYASLTSSAFELDLGEGSIL